MFDRFTDGARRGVVRAQEEARRLNHDYIGTEHLLLGILWDPGEVATQAAAKVGLSLDDARRRLEEIIGRAKRPPAAHIPFTPQAKKTLELSLREALILKHNYIGTEHILLGLIAEGDGIAARILTDVAGDLGRVRQEVMGLLR